MSIQTILLVAVQASIFFTVLTIGMGTSGADLRYVLGDPRRLVRSLLAMNVLGPVIAILVCKMFSLHPAVIVALVTLAIAPVSNMFPKAMLPLVAAGRSASYAYGLFCASTVLSVVLTPLAVEVINVLFSGENYHVSPLLVARVVIGTMLLPLGIGLVVGSRWAASRAWIPSIQKVSGIVLLACAVIIVAAAWPAMASAAWQGTVSAIVIISLAGLAAGHLLGGPDEDNRTVLAHATVSRHPGVAIAVASLTGQALAPAGVLFALLVSAVAVLPYTRWRKRLRTRASVSAAGQSGTRWEEPSRAEDLTRRPKVGG